MKIVGRIPYKTTLDVPFQRCDLCGVSEYADIIGADNPLIEDFIPMFKAEDDGIEYTLCVDCADKEAGVK